MDRLAHLTAEVTAVRAVLAEAELDAAVAACPGWQVRDAVQHLGAVHRWATSIVRTAQLQAQPEQRVSDEALPAWFAEGAEQLTEALAAADPAAPCWSFTADRTVGFWLRRQALETAVHRWDVQSAIGEPDAIHPELAADGVREVVDLMLPRQQKAGRLAELPHAVRLRAVDTGTRATIGEGEPVAELHAPAELLLLLLWHRLDPGDPRLHVTGDRAAATEVLRLPLAP
jgi:uncharacterized protein (TIGR03083 family)